MPEVPQGVAQRTIGQMISAGRLYPVHGYREEMELRRAGAEELLYDLSAEARRVLLENEDALERARSSKDAVEHHRLVIRRLTLINTFQRLGLDLESEDSDE